ncbi:MAG: HNH endonuclease signature motif containing protein, partial [Bacteroidales bacterium]|nr:HNH endonuclease signature motif containing protein [Bacteroidales bacterium]
EKHLNIRQFKESDKRYAYENQFGVCIKCGEHFSIEEMEADHILPWAKGGKTDKDNCQMLCKQCNRRKSDK